MIDLIKFNKAVESGDTKLLDYLEMDDSIMKNDYIKDLILATRKLYNCSLNKNFDYLLYIHAREELFKALGLVYDTELGKYIMIGENK